MTFMAAAAALMRCKWKCLKSADPHLKLHTDKNHLTEKASAGNHFLLHSCFPQVVEYNI